MRRARLYILGLFLFFVGAWRAASAAPLVLTFSESEAKVRVEARLGTQTKTYVLPYRARDFEERMETLYVQLESRKSSRKKLWPVLQTVGAAVYGPIGPMIESCSEIQFVIPPRFVKFPLDLMLYRDSFLFSRRPVSYAFAPSGGGAPRAFTLSSSMGGVIVSDPSADPEDGCAVVKRLLPSARYFKIDQLTPARLAALGTTDVLLISAHGDVSFDETDCLKMGKSDLAPRHVAALHPKLVYLDSCQLGASRLFIDALRKAGTQYYLAPIVSNEAGDSSTKTIAWFFTALSQGQPPPQALFTARTKLYQKFAPDESFADLLWKAFPFRVYRLN